MLLEEFFALIAFGGIGAIFLWICWKVIDAIMEILFEREGFRVKLKWYLVVPILSFAILGFVMMVPWSSSRSNFLGYESICSFFPFSAIVLFAISVALYTYATKHRKVFYGTMLILLAVFGFTGLWFYDYELPMNSLDFSMTKKSFWTGTETAVTEGNMSSIFFYLTIKNPSGRETPAFIIEPRHIAIDNKRLTSGYSVYSWNGTSSWAGLRWFYHPTSLKPHENITLLLMCWIYYKWLEVEGATQEEIYSSIAQGNFTFSMRGSLTVKPYFGHKSTSTWAARSFIVSQQFE